MSKPYRKRNLRLLISGRLATDTAALMQLSILPLYILERGGSASTIGLFLFASFLPMMLLSPFAGVLGDRHNRKHIMVFCDGLSASLVMILLTLAMTNSLTLPLLFLLQSLLGISQIFFDSSSGGMIPALVAKENLGSANSKMAATRVIAAIVGPVLGANLYSQWGVEALFAVGVCSFSMSAIAESLIQYQHATRPAVDAKKSVITDMVEGVQFILGQRLILSVCLFFALVTFTIAPILQITVPLVYKTLTQLPEIWYGYLQNFSAIGGLIGSIFAAVSLKKFGFSRNFVNANGMIMFSLFCLSVVFMPIFIKYLSSHLFVYFVLFGLCLLILTCSFTFITIPMQTLIQHSTPQHYLSRVYSLVGLISKGGMPIGAFVYGLILAEVSVHWVVLGTALLLAPIFILFSRFLLAQHIDMTNMAAHHR